MLEIIVACNSPSFLWVYFVLISPCAVLLVGWKWAPRGNHVRKNATWEVTEMLDLFVPLGGCLCLVSWPGRSGPTPLQCFWSAGLVVEWRWDWGAGSLESSPLWGREDPLSQVSLVGPVFLSQLVCHDDWSLLCARAMMLALPDHEIYAWT